MGNISLLTILNKEEKGMEQCILSEVFKYQLCSKEARYLANCS